MRGKIFALSLVLSLSWIQVPAVHAETVSAAESQKALDLYNQRQYAASASAFEAIIHKQPTARYCYYAALAQKGAGKAARAQQLFQYVVTNFPQSPEATQAKKYMSAPVAASGSSSSASNDLPDSVKSLIPKEMQAMLETPAGKQALQQVLSDKKDQIDTIRKAEKAGALPHDKVAAVAEAAGVHVAHPELNKDHPFSPEDIAKLGSRGIDQYRYPNCWFEASMSALADLPRGQKLIANMIKMKSADKYVVRFPGDGNEYVITNTDLQTAEVKDRALWASLIECAEAMKNNEKEGHGGELEAGLHLITGAKAEIMNSPAEKTPQELSSFIGGAITSKNPIVCATHPFEISPKLVEHNHAYTIIGFDPSSNMITIRNPWGVGDKQYELESDPQHLKFQQMGDGVFKMSIPVFQKYFDEICRSFI